MSLITRFVAFSVSLLALGAALARAEPLTASQQSLLDAKLSEIAACAAEPAVVKAVAAQNAALPPAYAEMTQEKWKALTLLDPFVRSFTKNEAAAALKARKADWLSEAFVNDAKGLKVAFLGKTTSWSHGASAKHTDPMAGKTWRGTVELDDSTGLQQVQVAVPVLVDGKPAGSLVVGVLLSKL